MKDKKYNFLLGMMTVICCVLGLILGAVLSEPEPEPSEPETVRCYDRVYGVVYGCFEREDGDIEIIMNEEGNRVITGICEKDPRYK